MPATSPAKPDARYEQLLLEDAEGRKDFREALRAIAAGKAMR